MKKYSHFFASILLMVFFSACRDRNDLLVSVGDPFPVDTTSQRTFRLLFNNISGTPDLLTDLTAIITIKNAFDQVVAEDKVVPVQQNTTFTTATITLAKGAYKISGLLIKQGDTAVRFASPIAGSTKAALVTKPLDVAILLDEKIEKTFPVEVLPVAKTDLAQSFGYPQGTFGNGSNDPGSTADKRVYIRPLIKVGDIVYDSIPVQLVMRSWDVNGNMSYNAFYLPAGKQPVNLPATAVKYQLSISKWGTYDEIVLMKNDVQADAVYILGGTKAAKKLSAVLEAKLVGSTLTPLTKTAFNYLPNGELQEVLLWGKKADMTTYLQRRELFEYSNSKITKIRAYDETNALLSTTSFGYNASGKVVNMEEIIGSNKTTATVQYIGLEGGTGISNNYHLGIHYTYTDKYYTANFGKTIRGGNVATEMFATTHGDMEEAMYDYDFSINPFVHLAKPDLMLGGYSKHNVKAQYKTWAGSFPLYVPLAISYTYDADGYPTEKLTKYRSYYGTTEVYSIKTLYQY